MSVRRHFRDASPEVGARPAAGETVDPSEYYFRACKKIEKPQLHFVIPAKERVKKLGDSHK